MGEGEGRTPLGEGAYPPRGESARPLRPSTGYATVSAICQNNPVFNDHYPVFENPLSRKVRVQHFIQN